MIRIRNEINRGRFPLTVFLALALACLALIFAHGPGAAHMDHGDHGGEKEMSVLTICLAVFAGGGLALGLLLAGRRMRRIRWTEMRSGFVVMSVPVVPPTPRSRAGPAYLQVFLR